MRAKHQVRAQELDDLAEYRLDWRLSFPQLAELMGKAGFAISHTSLHGAITGKNGFPRELTLHPIRKFVEHERAAGRLPWTREAAEAAAAKEAKTA